MRSDQRPTGANRVICRPPDDARPPRPRRRRFLWRRALTLLAVTFGLPMLLGAQAASPTHTPPPPAPRVVPVAADNPFRRNVVSVLLSAGQTAERADLVLLALCDFGHGRVALLNVPRETRGAAGESLDEVWRDGQAPALARQVATLTGVRVLHSLRLGPEFLRTAVDAVGGVPLTVEAPLRYSDRAQGLEIDLAAGRQRLDGARAEQYVRFASDGATGRWRRQARFLLAATRTLGDTPTPEHLRTWATALAADGGTDLSATEVLYLAKLMARAGELGVVSAQLPGAWADGESGQVFTPAAEARAFSAKLLASLADGPPRPSVTIYNGSDRLGLEQLAASRLQAAGMVTAVSATPVPRLATTAIHEVDSPTAAAAVAKTLGLSAAGATLPAECPPLDTAHGPAVVVVLGNDYRGR